MHYRYEDEREDPASAPRGVLLGIMISAALVLAGIGLTGCWLQIRAAIASYPEAWLGMVGTAILLAGSIATGVSRYRTYHEGWGGFVWISACLASILLSFVLMVVG